MHAKDKFVAFIDIVGFKELVKAAEREGGDFTRAFELATALGSAVDSDKFKSHGPTTCPRSRFLNQDLDFQVTQISDCVVISVEVSPAGVSNLTSHCFGIAMNMLHKNALCRGYITRGRIYHSNGQVVGTGYMAAYDAEGTVAFLKAEDEGATPFIQIDDSVLRYVRDETDECVRMMFDRATQSDGLYTAIYPFKALGNIPTALIQPDFDPIEFRQSVRRSIAHRERNLGALKDAEALAPSEKERAKVRHYMHGLEEVIRTLCAKEAWAQNMINTGRIPYGMVI